MLKTTLISLWHHRSFIWEMSLRDLKVIHRGALLGILWLVLNPLVQTVAYVVILSVIFKARTASSMDAFSYALYVLSGMIPWQFMSRSLQEAPSMIRERMELLKQVVYPIETLPLNTLVMTALGSSVSLAIFFLGSLWKGTLTPSCLLLPIPCILAALGILGASWIFSIVGVLIKDLREVVTVCFSLMVYFSPVVISESMVGEKIWRYILWNPLAHVVVCFRDVFYSDFHAMSWAIFCGMSLLALFLGCLCVHKAKMFLSEYL